MFEEFKRVAEGEPISEEEGRVLLRRAIKQVEAGVGSATATRLQAIHNLGMGSVDKASLMRRLMRERIEELVKEVLEMGENKRMPEELEREYEEWGEGRGWVRDCARGRHLPPEEVARMGSMAGSQRATLVDGTSDGTWSPREREFLVHRQHWGVESMRMGRHTAGEGGEAPAGVESARGVGRRGEESTTHANRVGREGEVEERSAGERGAQNERARREGALLERARRRQREERRSE